MACKRTNISNMSPITVAATPVEAEDGLTLSSGVLNENGMYHSTQRLGPWAVLADAGIYNMLDAGLYFTTSPLLRRASVFWRAGCSTFAWGQVLTLRQP